MVLVLFAGCGAPASHGPILAGTSQASVAPRSIARNILPLLARLQVAYQRDDLSSIGSLFLSRSAARDLEARMRRWMEEGVNPLRLTLVYARRMSSDRLVATVEFWSDIRAVPTYNIFILQRTNKGFRIEGTDRGLHGATFSSVNWTVSRSRHFTIYHSPYQLAGSDRGVLSTLEAQRSLFEKRFGVHVAPSIAYYLYPDSAMMTGMSQGGCGTMPEIVGCALPYTRPPSIHTIEWPSYHEPIHVYELALEPPPQKNGLVLIAPLFISEGTAVALEERQLDPTFSDYCSDLSYVSLDACAQQALTQVKPLDLLPDTGFQKGNLVNSYFIGGSFVKYLILHYGYHQFGRFYYSLAAQPKDRLQDYEVAARSVFHASIRTLLSQWSGSLCHSGC